MLTFYVRSWRSFLLVAVLFGPGRLAAGEAPFGLEQRVLWTGSRLAGSPEPPLPYTVERTFTNVTWKSPMYVVPEPGTDRLLVVQEGGQPERPSRVLRIKDDPATTEAELFLEVPRRLVYSVCFHPGYRTNGVLYLFSNGPTGASHRTNQITRYTVERRSLGAAPEPAPGPGRLQSGSERIVIEWPSSGHDGGDMAFGRDGMFYLTTGDGSSDSDALNSGQTLDDLQGGVLRIDVNRGTATQPYAVPADNPFVNRAGARPEIWAYGLRNPWRMDIDPVSGQVWVGNNGQDLWETAHLVRPGENYGWSVYEGGHPFYLGRERGPTPHVLPTIEHSHADFRSLTGGVVCRGSRFPELEGVYVYGDYSSGRIWGMKHDGRRVLWHRELADTSLQIAAFRVSHGGDLLVVDHGGGLYRLALAPRTKRAAPFPARLSQTGLFQSVKDHQVAPGVIPYSINAPAWADGAVSERFMAVPGGFKVGFEVGRGWNFPEGTVLVQTFFLERTAGQPATRFRVETRLLVRFQGEWAGYSYRWNARQTDASLVAGDGAEIALTLREAADRNLSGVGGGGSGGDPSSDPHQRLTWRFPSRAECMACHSRQANFVLGLSGVQLNRDREYEGVRDNQLRALNHVGFFTNALGQAPQGMARLPDPGAATVELEARARAYLHVNCSMCHVEAGGGNSKMELEFTRAKDRMNLIGARPQHDSFGLDNAMLVAPGDPGRSVLLHRLSHRGRGQMPPLVSTRVDERAVRLMRDWIAQLKGDQPVVQEWRLADFLPALEAPGALEAGRSVASGQAAFRQVGCIQCHRVAGEGGTVGPDLSGVGLRLKPRELLESILEPSKVVADSYATDELELTDGETLSGRIEREDGQSLVLRPLAFGEASREVQQKQVRRRRRSTTSPMPAGMANTLSREQVLDLLAYLQVAGAAAPAGATEPHGAPAEGAASGDPTAAGPGPAAEGARRTMRVAGLTTVYRHNSHADVILSRLLLTDRLDGTGRESPLKLVSLYTDQKPANDISRLLAASRRFLIGSNIAETLTLGTGALAVDGVFLIAEHGDYPRSTSGSTQYPKRRFWDEMLEVFRRSGRVVPVFVDKHLADNWADAKHLYDTARAMKIPLMAGSSVPGSWRHPAADVERGAALSEIVVLTFGSTDHYGFHALECLQALAEQRQGGETGVRAVQCLTGPAVWAAQREKRFDPELFEAAMSRLSRRQNGDRPLSEAVKEPILWQVEYLDGLRASVLELNGAVGEWTGAWRYRKDQRIESTQFWTQEARPAAHFTLLLNGIEQLMLTGQPGWNVERTLLTSGLLDALLQSRAMGGVRQETPHLQFGYQPIWRWSQPPPPPPGRPWSEQ